MTGYAHIRRLGLAALMASLLPAGVAAQGMYEELMSLSGALNVVQANYVDEVDGAAVVEGAVRGALASLDPHSTYVPASQAEAYAAMRQGDRAGIGVQLTVVEGEPMIVSVVPGGAADRSRQVRPGDVIVTVDGEPALGLPEGELSLLLTGEEGSEVDLGMRRLRAGGDERATYRVELTRRKLADAAVSSWTVDTPGGRVGYVRLAEFNGAVLDAFPEALKSLGRGGLPDRLILDLRGNPGGRLDAAIVVAEPFLEKGDTLYTISGRKVAETHVVDNRRRAPRIPMAVLIDQGSASASELVAGALQDHDEALIVGERTFGKGLVQQPHRLSSGGYVSLTIGRYFTPSGRLIQRDYEGMSLRAYREAMGTTPEDAPEYRTSRGRPVYGGGGIAPDVPVDIPEPPADPSVVWAAAQAHAETMPDAVALDRFLADPLPPEARERLGDGADDPGTVLLFKDAVAGLRWGDDGRRQALLRTDPVVVRALESLASPPRWLQK